MYERWLLGIAPAIAVPSGHARANGTRANAHVTSQRKKVVSLPNFDGNGVVWPNGAYREFYQHVGPYTVPARARARAKKGRERARTSSGFSLRNRSSPQFLRRQLVPPSSSVHVSNAGPRSRDSVLIASDSAR